MVYIFWQRVFSEKCFPSDFWAEHDLRELQPSTNLLRPDEGIPTLWTFSCFLHLTLRVFPHQEALDNDSRQLRRLSKWFWGLTIQTSTFSILYWHNLIHHKFRSCCLLRQIYHSLFFQRRFSVTMSLRIFVLTKKGVINRQVQKLQLSEEHK